MRYPLRDRVEAASRRTLQVSINKALEACGLDQKLAAGRRSHGA
jgi:hypothetical protein